MSAPLPAPPVSRRRRWLRRLAWAWVLVALPLTIGGLYAYRTLMPGALFLARMSDPRPEADFAGGPFVEAERTIPAADLPGATDPLRIRTYVPPDATRAVLFVHGVHPRGIDEPRLVSVARKLAGVGIAVVTPQVEPLTTVEVTPAAVDRIERAALWLLDRSDLVPAGGQIGMMGICFGGGLTISAAGRDSLAERTAFAFAIGAHAELRPVLRFLVTGKTGERDHAPDPYGSAVVLKQVAERVVPADQVAPLKALLDRYLRDGEESGKAHVHELPEPARTLASQAIHGELDKLAPTLLPHLDALRTEPSLSPATAAVRCPVFLLHAHGDRVIPREHAARLGAALAPRTPVEVLVTPLFEHADIQEGGWSARLALAAFITRMLRS